MKKINLLISFFIFFSLISLLFFSVNTVNAYIIDVNTSFEDGTLSLPYSNSWLYTKQIISLPDVFYVDNSAPTSGIKDFRGSAPEGGYKNIGYFNYTYSDIQFIHLWECTFSGYFSPVHSWFYVYFSFRNSSGSEIINLRRDIGNGNIYAYKNYLGVYVTVKSGASAKFGFVFTNNDTVNYYDDSTVLIGSPSGISDKCNITSLLIYTYCGNPSPSNHYGFYLDENRIVISDTISGSGITPGVFPECPSSEIGNLVSTSDCISLPPWYQYVTMIYKVVSTFNITEYRVLLENIYYLSYYHTIELKINGYNIGYPTQTHSYGNTILLTWGNLSGVNINGEMVYMCFKFPRHLTHPYSPDPQIPYFYQTIQTFDKTDNDIDNDGFTTLSVHADTNYWNDFCNNHHYRDYGMSIYDGYSPISEDFDLDYSFCYSDRQEGTTHNYINDLFVDPTIVNVGETVNIGYTISGYGLGYTNYLEINKSGVIFENVKLESQGGNYVYRPLSLGLYNVSLVQNSIKIKTLTFLCVGILPDVYVLTDVAQTFSNRDFIIMYKYPYTEYIGEIRYTLSGVSDTITNVNKNSSGNFTYSLKDEGYYTITLNINNNGNYFQVAQCKIVINNIHGNYIELSDYVIVTPKSISVFGTHNFIGSSVFIYRNAESLKYVGDTIDFQMYDYIISSKYYNYTLIVKYGSRTILLDYKILFASSTTPNEDTEDTVDWFTSFINGLPFFVKIIIAITIVLMITLLPLIVTVLLSRTAHFDSVEIPSLVYIGFFIFGVIIDCLIGLFSWAILFVILLSMIIAFAVIYISNKKEA